MKKESPSHQPLKILVNGSRGRMGQAIIRCAATDPALKVIAEIDVGDDFAAALPLCDGVVDFSHATETARVAQACADAAKTLVIGTTGQDAAARESIARAAKKIPVVYAANYSVGVNTLFWLTRKAVEILGSDFDLEVVEMHHRFKKDAPSGTARRLAEILAEGRALAYEKHVTHGREGMVGERPHDEIGMHALRGGDVVGDHTVIFAGQGERVELTHKAANRDILALGALRAFKWAHGRAAALYDMEDVLGLRVE